MADVTANFMREFHAAVARIVACLAGSDPLDVWASYRSFEDDLGILVDAHGAVVDIAKPSLEERARARERKRSNATGAPDARSVLVSVATEEALNRARSKQLETENRVRAQEPVNHLDDEE